MYIAEWTAKNSNQVVLPLLQQLYDPHSMYSFHCSFWSEPCFIIIVTTSEEVVDRYESNQVYALDCVHFYSVYTIQSPSGLPTSVVIK